MDNDFFDIKDNYVLLKVKASTKSSKNAINGIKNGELSVSVTTVPENGKANESIVKLLSKEFKCAKSKINLISGEKSRNKLFRIDEILDFSKITKIDKMKA